MLPSRADARCAEAERPRARPLAVLTGLEPATSALTGRRALQLLHRTWSGQTPVRAPNGIRTRATALKGRRPGPLDDEGGPAIIAHACGAAVSPSGPAGGLQSIREPRTIDQTDTTRPRPGSGQHDQPVPLLQRRDKGTAGGQRLGPVAAAVVQQHDRVRRVCVASPG